MNLTSLYESCAKSDKVGFVCDFQVSSSFNYDEGIWYSNGKTLDDVVWKSVSYPRIDDILVVCGLLDKLVYVDTQHTDSSQTKAVRYCMKNTPSFNFERTNYLDHNYQLRTQLI